MLRVVAGEGAVLENRIGKQVGRRHRRDEIVVLEALLEVFLNLIALGGSRVDRDHVVVVKIHAIGADFAEQIADLDDIELLADRFAEGIATGVADRPEAEGELEFGIGFVRGHARFSCQFRRGGTRRESFI